jgi:hypothetical protein
VDLDQVQEEARKRVLAIQLAQKAAETALKKQRLTAILRAWNNRVVQAMLDRFIALYIVIKGKDRMQRTPGTGQVVWGPTPQLAGIGALLDDTLHRLGPEAIPAIVKGINTTARFKVGFC